MITLTDQPAGVRVALPDHSPKVVGVLAVQGDFREHAEMVRALGHAAREIRKPDQLDGIDALIIPGGESTTIARLMQNNGLTGPIRDLAHADLPVWGTCAGAILLAQQVDQLDRPGIEVMDIEVHRNAFGRQVESFEADLTIEGLAGALLRAVFIRAPVIQRVFGRARAIAALDDGTVVAARQGNLLATSFHPELTDDHRLHELFLSFVTTAGISNECG